MVFVARRRLGEIPQTDALTAAIGNHEPGLIHTMQNRAPSSQNRRRLPAPTMRVDAACRWIGFVLLLACSWSLGETSNEEPWWSLKPLHRPAVPTLAGPAPEALRPRNPLDAFLLTELRNRGLTSSPEADRRVLIRRLTFDLLGLPPTPEEIREFVNDPDPSAYERLVDRLLASPHFGERWARHWLDLVHFGETHGYDKDKPRPNAWPYRDYVIRAINEDRHYSRFIQEQLAGDVLFPLTRDGVEGLGFIAAGPWDFIGHAEVPETKIDGRIARHLDRDDMVANSIQTFASTTVQCAQCHHHKFDPISTDEYYQLQAVFAAVDRTDVKYDTDPQVASRRSSLSRSSAQAKNRKETLLKSIEARARPQFDALDKEIQSAEASVKRQSAFGYHSQPAASPDTPKWVQVDLGATVEITRVVLHACEDDFNQIGRGFGFPSRYDVQASEDPEFKEKVFPIAERASAGESPRKLDPVVVIPPRPVPARYVRITASKLAPRKDDFIFALAELEVFGAGTTNRALQAKVSALDSTDAPPRWARSNLTDGWWPGPEAEPTHPKNRLDALQSSRRSLLAQWTRPEEATELQQLEASLKQLAAELQSLPAQSLVYAGAIHTGSGAFAGTGPNGGKPRPIHVLARGNILKPGPEVAPGALRAVPGLSAAFDLAPDHREGDRRAALARWLSDSNNPLTWRSAVNRIWQHHFGRALVDTPNDFGRMGAKPTHPALLDWLACEFRDGGQSFKTLHRLIVTSRTYRQSSASHSANAALDSDNRFLWRMNRRKLDAESVRDSFLSVSGVLNPRMGGASFQDFVIEKPEHSPHYEYHLHDPGNPASHRRSIYRFLVRSQPQPFMAALDCADPSMQVARRNESQSALQALALLNNPLALTLAERFARRLEREDSGLSGQITRAHELALGRPPAPERLLELRQFAQSHGLPNTCRLLFNLNEFLFID